MIQSHDKMGLVTVVFKYPIFDIYAILSHGLGKALFLLLGLDQSLRLLPIFEGSRNASGRTPM